MFLDILYSFFFYIARTLYIQPILLIRGSFPKNAPPMKSASRDEQVRWEKKLSVAEDQTARAARIIVAYLWTRAFHRNFTFKRFVISRKKEKSTVGLSSRGGLFLRDTPGVQRHLPTENFNFKKTYEAVKNVQRACNRSTDPMHTTVSLAFRHSLIDGKSWQKFPSFPLALKKQNKYHRS